MQLSLQNFSTLVNGMAATVQGSCASLIDLTVGSVLRAILEASASIALWLQYLLLQVLTMTRLATSIGSDADSWVQDFGMTRLPPTFATGQIILASFNPGSQAATVPNGATVRTSDGSQSFVVVGGPYIRPVGTPAVIVSVQAISAGPAGNVQAGTISLLGTAIPGIDTVSNPVTLAGGTAAETDAALRLRFVTYINTRSQATEQAIGYAIASVQQGLSYSIQENVTPDGAAAPGHVNVIVDDGSGAPPAGGRVAVAAALAPIRPVGTLISVNPPALLVAVVSLTISIDASETFSDVQASVQMALSTYINSLGVGQALRFSRLAGLAYDADAGITNVQNVLLNSNVVDLGGGQGTVVRAGMLTVQTIAA